MEARIHSNTTCLQDSDPRNQLLFFSCMAVPCIRGSHALKFRTPKRMDGTIVSDPLFGTQPSGRTMFLGFHLGRIVAGPPREGGPDPHGSLVTSSGYMRGLIPHSFHLRALCGLISGKKGLVGRVQQQQGAVNQANQSKGLKGN